MTHGDRDRVRENCKVGLMELWKAYLIVRQGQRTLNSFHTKNLHQEAVFQPQILRFMARLTLPGCCFSRDKVKRRRHAKFSAFVRW